MRFALDETAQTLREVTAELLRDEVTPAVIRAGWPGGDRALVDAAWGKLAALGVPGLLVDEGDGGLGLDENALVPVLDEIGYSGLPVPAAETIAVAAPLIGGARPTMITAAPEGELIPFGQCAPLVVMRQGNTLRVYERDSLVLEPADGVDGSRLLARLAGIRGAGESLTADPAEVERAWDRGALGTAALLTGLARRMLDMTVSYVKQREQFGVPVGSFQAIKHALADAYLAIEFARPLGLAAGWAQANRSAGLASAYGHGADARALTSAAKVRAADAARLVARTAIQCHGAMGYTTEYDLHLFAKRAWALAPAWGDPGYHRTRIASTIGMSMRSTDG